MIRNQAKSTAHAEGFAGVGTFAIKNSSKAFKILSDNIYKDKVAAIIRELSCNASDSHVDAGNDQPFEIWLPTMLSPEFKIRDYGTGLPHEKVMTLYVTYFESTKETSNDFAGTLGLGSKAPFSYVDTFTVASYYNGKKHLYVAYISQDNVPAILYQGEVDTDEHNGLEISFPVQSRDLSAFKIAAGKILQWFDQKPIVHPKLDFSTFSKVEIGSNWYTYNSYDFRGAYIKQGPIVYPLDMKLCRLDDKLSDAANRNIIVEVPMGAVDFEPGREQLNYDDTTVANIQKALTTVYNEISERISTALAKEPTPFKKLVAFKKMFDHTSTLRLETFANTAKNGIFDGKFDVVPECKVYIIAPDRISPSAMHEWYDITDPKFKNRTNTHDLFRFSSVPTNFEFFTYTNEPGGITKFQTHMKNHTKYTTRVFICGNKNAVDQVVKNMGSPDVTSLNGVLQKTIKAKTTCYIMNSGTTYDSKFKRTDHISQVKDSIDTLSGYYIFVESLAGLELSHKSKLLYRYCTPEDYFSLMRDRYIAAFAQMSFPKKIYIFRDRDSDEVRKNKNLIHFDEFLIDIANGIVKTKFQDLVASKFEPEELEMIKYCRQINEATLTSPTTREMFNTLSKWYDTINKGQFGTWGHRDRELTFASYCLGEGLKTRVENGVDKIRNGVINKLYAKYPMLKHVDMRSHRTYMTKDIVAYINMVDNVLSKAKDVA